MAYSSTRKAEGCGPLRQVASIFFYLQALEDSFIFGNAKHG